MVDTGSVSLTPEFDSAALPDGWTARVPRDDDIPALIELLEVYRRSVRGSASADPGLVRSAAVGLASWTRRQVVVTDDGGRIVAWATAHDRAAGRTMSDITVWPDLPEATVLAAALYAWTEAAAVLIARGRGLDGTQLDATPYADDERQLGWLTDAGYARKRTWLQMSRPVEAREAEPGVLPEPREGVRVRRVATTEEGGLPVAADLQDVHLVLEQSFADHFNSYRESFPEFVQRQREDPGHRWDHWWIAEVEMDGEWLPGGAVVSTVLLEDEAGHKGSYIDYIGVHRRSRGRGVAKALLYTVIRDAAERGRDRVELEVDADSPTGADGLYTSLGWITKYRTESWHKDITVADSAIP